MSEYIIIKSIFELNKSLNSLKAIVELSCEEDPIHDLLTDVVTNFETRYSNHLKVACTLQSECDELKTQISKLTQCL
jgi:hypothetical protein